MNLESESDRRAYLRQLGEHLIELSADKRITVDTVNGNVYASTCDMCNGYGRDVFESITLSFSR